MAILFEYLLLDIVVLASCIITGVYFYFQHTWTYWKKRNVPYVQPTFPFGNFGDVVFARKSMGELFNYLYAKLEGEKFGGTYTFTKKGFFFRDPELIKSILVKDFPSFHDRGLFFDDELDPLVAGLFFLPGNRWRNLRVKLSPTFTSGKMKMMFQTLVDCGQELGECLDETAEKEEVIEIKDVMARYSTDVISSCAFGIQCNCLKNPDAEFRQWGRKIFEPSLRSAIIALLSSIAPSLLKVLKFRGLDPNISKYFRRMVEDTVKYRESNNIKRNDFMQLLIQLKNKGIVDVDYQNDDHYGQEVEEEKSVDKEFSMDNLAAQVFMFYTGGFETAASTMTFCLYELALNPDIQKRLSYEILEVMEKYGGKITYESIQDMEYLDKVVSETLRKYPISTLLNRECTKSYRIPDTDIVLEKGTPIFIPVLALHNDPKYYPNPERFDPERFSEEEKAKRHHYVYLPFGEGPRICIGMRFGQLQTKVGLIYLLSRYEFNVSKKTPVPLVIDKQTIFLSPLGGMYLQVKKRTN
ncbi:probable cytochrome P450 6a13 [Periplaneta americana]|uniref:probable cytochrome P450 6a13 n=1 Tax=Periplaneta americana TaxID=6978 RepID=UPI0037E8D6BC